MHCTVLLCVKYNVNLCLFSSWFAKEANVTNNNNEALCPPKRVVRFSVHFATSATRKAGVWGIWNTPKDIVSHFRIYG